MKKFRFIIEQKKQTAAPAESPGRRGRIMIPIVILALLIPLPAWLLIRDNPSDSAAVVQEEVTAQNAPVTEESTPSTELALASVDPEPLEAEPAHDNNPFPEESSPDRFESVPVPEEEAVSADVPAAVPGVEITDIQICRRVENRECVMPVQSFSLGEKVKPTVWMTVMLENPPLTLTHAYHLNGQAYCTVPLTIGHTRTRTWSRITVNKETHLGNWRVDVLNGNGLVLDRVNFEVLP